MRRLAVAIESFPVKGAFTISRSSVTAIEVVTATITDGDATGRGECRPYPRYGETPAGVTAQIEAARGLIEGGGDREALRAALPAGAARNALDCALWDLEAKLAGEPVWRLAGLPEPVPLTTAYTLSLGEPAAMAAAAREAEGYPLLKLKLAGEGDAARVAAVRAARPDARLIVDANEAWTPTLLPSLLAAMAEAGVELVEQPLPAGRDDALADLAHTLPICADESAHDAASLEALVRRYDAVNLKLDKTGGLTEALAFARRAEALGLALMVGCMVGTSLAMAPAALLGPLARWIDLDGPLLLARDRESGLRYVGAGLHPAPAGLWG